MQRQWIGAVLVASVVLGFGLGACAKNASSKTVASGSVVNLQYSLTADNVPVVRDDAPQILKLTVGQGRLPVLFEKKLIGLPVGAAKAIALKPEEAFGLARKELLVRVPRSALPPGEVKEGMMLTSGPVTAKVIKIMEDGSVVIDRNHPLAGKNLLYKIRVMSVS